MLNLLGSTFRFRASIARLGSLETAVQPDEGRCEVDEDVGEVEEDVGGVKEASDRIQKCDPGLRVRRRFLRI